jgi:hypothetical protein
LKDHLPAARNSMLRQLFEDIDRDLQDPKQIVKVKKQDGTEIEIPRLSFQFLGLFYRENAAFVGAETFPALQLAKSHLAFFVLQTL